MHVQTAQGYARRLRATAGALSTEEGALSTLCHTMPGAHPAPAQPMHAQSVYAHEARQSELHLVI